jgi:hypothetical protein
VRKSDAAARREGTDGGSYGSSSWGRLKTETQTSTEARVIAWDELGSEMSWLGEGEFATAHKTVLDGRSAAVKRLKKAKSDTPTAVRGLKREIVLSARPAIEHGRMIRTTMKE